MAMWSPVRGLRPWRAGRDLVEEVPKPAILAVSPWESVSAMVGRGARVGVGVPTWTAKPRWRRGRRGRPCSLGFLSGVWSWERITRRDIDMDSIANGGSGARDV